jgi:hypothetical protein
MIAGLIDGRPKAPPARRAAYAVAFAFAALIAYDLWRMPVQVSDSLIEILEAQQSASVTSSFAGAFSPGSAYLRPLRIAQIKALQDLAQPDHHTVVYRGFHVVLLVVLFWLFVRALQVESIEDLAAAVFALTVLVGLHTFAGLVREAFPINHFLEIAVFSLAALNLAQSRGGWLVDLLAVGLFAAAVLTLESGLLVAVIALAARTVGLRGLSARGAGVMLLVLLAYFLMRADALLAGGPSLAERNSGFLLERLEPEQIEERFGDARTVYYTYNVASSASSVLLSEPRDGTFVAVRAWIEGEVPPRVYLALGSSMATTMMIAWWVASRRKRSGGTGDRERVATVAGLALLASAAMSFAYAKDDVMSAAGVFYAVLAYVAVRALAAQVGEVRRRAAALGLSLVLLVTASAWAVRALSLDHILRWQAFRVRNDWAFVDRHLEREGRTPTTAEGKALVARLQADAIEAAVPNPQRLPRWNDRWFGQ